MNFSILAPGNIANTMARTVNQMETIHCYAVASRNLEKAQEFSRKYQFEKAYGSYEEMLLDPKVELVYVCTPHSLHYQYAKICLEHGKHVIVEKPFTVNASQAEELIHLSEERGLFITEAIWTRYMPSRKMMTDIISTGVIGKVTSLTANLGYPLTHVERLQRPELAGGALLDLGVYPINFASMIFPGKIERISSDAVMSPEGIDWMNSITLKYEDKSMAVLHSTMVSSTDRLGLIYGEKGHLEIQNINNCEEIRVYNQNYEMIQKYQVPKQITGFEYQVQSSVQAIQQGKTECEEMPHSEILRMMKVMDEIRNQWGMKFPCEYV